MPFSTKLDFVIFKVFTDKVLTFPSTFKFVA